MLTIEGTYLNGQLTLPERIKTNHPVKVLVTFLEDIELPKTKPGRRFSFKKSRELFKNCKGSLSQMIIEERRSAL
ncbi:hypothetical protein L0128_07430 [candidate division KSB1 bacterium]|nr:hypothetical protein [candidate division KSB1 bacterium]